MAKESTNRVAKGYLQTTRYFNNSLNPGEEMLYRAHLSWIPVFVWQIPFMMAAGVFGGLAWGISTNFLLGVAVFIGIMIFGIISQFPRIWTNIGTDILLTNQGLHSKRGVFIVKDDRFTRLNMLDDSDIDYGSFFQRVFKYGNVEIKTIAGADAFYSFKGLARPVTFKNTVRAAQNKYVSGGGGTFEEQARVRYDANQGRSQGRQADRQTLNRRSGGGSRSRRQ